MKKGVNSVLKASLLAGAMIVGTSLAACATGDGGEDAGDGDGDADAGCASCSSCAADAGCASCASCSSDGGM